VAQLRVVVADWGKRTDVLFSESPVPRHQHHVTLTAEERTDLQTRVRRGAVPALTQTRARILLHADRSQPGRRRTDAQIAEAVGCSIRSVARARAAWTARGMHCLDRRPSAQPPRPKLDSNQEARLVALSTGAPPAGHARWTLRLLATRAVELDIAESVSHELVRRTLKKRAEALADPSLPHSRRPEWGVCRGAGRRAGYLRVAAGPGDPPRVFR
jgi:hypothetical protein